MKNKKLLTFGWNVFNGMIAVAIAYMLDINFAYAPLLVPVLNLLTKELNRMLNPNYNKVYGRKE